MTDSGYIDLLSRTEEVLTDPRFQNELAQIRSKATLQAIGEPVTLPRWTYVAPRFSRNSAAALYALQAAALADPDSALERQDRSRQLALAWESLAKLSEGADRPTALLNAALAYELAGYQANAAYLASEILSEPPPGSNADAQSLVASFLQRRLILTTGLANHLLQTQPDPGLPLDALSFGLAEVVLGDGLSSACRFFLSGDNSAYDDAVVLLNEAAKLFDSMSAPLQANIAHGIQSVLPLMKHRSTWDQLGPLVSGSDVWKRYLTLLARGSAGPQTRGVTELWPSQIGLLESEFLGSDTSAVVRLPTSSGKTRIAEMAIVDAIERNPGAKCVFVAPFRALAFEVEITLGSVLNDLGYRVSSVVGSYESDEFEEFLLRMADLLIVTPEKLDLVLRLHPEIFEEIRLVVLDEAHMIDDVSRGIKFELLLNRMKARLPSCRFLAMSAVIPDSTLGLFAEWLAESPDRSIRSYWRPTIQRIAQFQWQGPAGVIRFERDQEIPVLNSFVPGVLQERTYSFVHPDTQRTRRPKYPQSNNRVDAAAELAYIFSEQGTVLVFCSQTNYVESVCKALLNKSIEYRRLAGEHIHPHIGNSVPTRSLDLSREWLGEEHIATLSLSQGIAPHYGRLPNVVREAIEADCRAGRYRVIVATNTLAQGVNLPVRTVVIHSTRRWDSTTGRRLRIPVRDYLNIAGRAGRAGQETEGLVVHITSNGVDRRDFHHYTNPENLEPVSGALFRLLLEIVDSRLSQETLEEAAAALDPEVIAIAVEEGIDEADSDKWASSLSGTLAELQADSQEIDISPLIEAVQHAASGVFTVAPELTWRRVYAQTGLISSSCNALRQFVDANEEELRRLLLSGSYDDVRLLNHMVINASLQLPEAQTTTEFAGDPEMLLDLWLDGAPINRIAESIQDTIASVEQLSRYIEELFGYRLPWIISALLRISKESLSLQDQDINDYIRSYPSMVKYGLSDPVAAWAMSAGVSTRSTALRIAEAFYQATSDELSYEHFVTWIAKLSDDQLRSDYEITGYALSDLRYKLGRMATNPLLRPIRPLHHMLPMQTEIVGVHYENRRIAARGVRQGDRLELRRDYENPVDPNAVAVHHTGGQIGFLPRHIAQRLAPDIDAGNTLVAETLMATRERVPAVTVQLQFE